MSSETIHIATRGSALALAQANLVLEQCRAFFPERRFELQIIKTTGDKLQTASLANASQQLPKGLFTKELEVALLNGEASFAVHSLKDLPTELPEGLHLGGASEREDVRDVLIYRSSGKGRTLPPGSSLGDFAEGATIATSSTRRQAQLLAVRADLKTVPIRGNVGTRLQKLADNSELDGIVLALAGLKRLGYRVGEHGVLTGASVPEGLIAAILPVEQMLPCVGQAALGYECRADDPVGNEICQRLTHEATIQAVTAERAFLQGMGGGCLSPVAAHAEVRAGELRIRAVSFQGAAVKRTEKAGPAKEAAALGKAAASELL
jgi:hydroxymethylbilane synthase